MAISYSTIVAVAAQSVMLNEPTGQIWTFSLFAAGSLTYAWMLGHQGVRMQRLTHLFERASEGDFDQPYEDGRDQGVLWQTGMRAFDTGGSRLSREIERMP
ncbi:MAG: hypothetical protein C0497_13865 [Gemmatimonas sp.]|nr:hypothetical protein [Gemmatimonas sp.]